MTPVRTRILGAAAAIAAAGGLALHLACQALNPLVAMEEAARRLHFSLDRVEPSLELAFPLEQSRLRLRMGLGVDNPSQTRLHAESLGGAVRLATGGQELAIGTLSFAGGVDLPAGSRAPLTADLVLGYNDLRQAWRPLQAVVLHHQAADWKVQGEARLRTAGIPLTVPFTAHKGSGS